MANLEAPEVQDNERESLDAEQNLTNKECASFPAKISNFQVKQFLDRWICDGEFRKNLQIDAKKTAIRYGITFDPEELRILWDDSYRLSFGQIKDPNKILVLPEASQILIKMKKMTDEYKLGVRNESKPKDSRFNSWRHRQIRRCDSSLTPNYALDLAHIPFSIELSKGCSVGCWFCGISAPKVSDHFCHTRENSRLFLDVLNVVNSFVGTDAGKWCILYWATDPFDNPDYELFCLDFYEVFERFPVTTTALGTKDIERTREFLRLSSLHGKPKFRFSTLSLKMFEKVYENFSPAELENVEILPMNRDSLVQPAEAGRARSNPRQRALRQGTMNEGSKSICCLSGFLLSMVDKTIKLITPCNSDENWELGYHIYDEKPFTDAENLKSVIEDLISKHMPELIPQDLKLQFRSDLSYCELDDEGFTVNTKFSHHKVDGNFLLREIGDLIHEGNSSANEIALQLERQYGVKQTIVFELINQIFSLGLIDEIQAKISL